MRVLAVDDNVELLDLVNRSLASDGHRVTLARDVATARTAIAEEEFDVIVLDLGLPDGSGVSLCKSLRMAELPTPILMLTAHAAVSDRVEGLDAGADDFMAKPFAVAELRARVRALGRRKGQPSSIVWAKDELSLDFSKKKAHRAGRDVPITAREWEILRTLAAARGRVVAQGELLDDIWGSDGESNRASLEVLVGRIRKKLGDGVIRTVRGEGYALQ